MVRAILRLGYKYQIQNLVEAGRAELAKRFPAKLSKWEKRKKYCEGVSSDVISMANTARTLQYHDIHARALYDCCQLPADMLVAGLSDCSGQQETLCTKDLAAVIEARETFFRLHYELVFVFSAPLHPDCHRSRKRVQRTLSKRVRELDRDCLAIWQDWIRDICLEHDVCQQCITGYLGQYTSACEDVLTTLHEYFRIDVSDCINSIQNAGCSQYDITNRNRRTQTSNQLLSLSQTAN